jgi:hypothetical protein
MSIDFERAEGMTHASGRVRESAVEPGAYPSPRAMSRPWRAMGEAFAWRWRAPSALLEQRPLRNGGWCRALLDWTHVPGCTLREAPASPEGARLHPRGPRRPLGIPWPVGTIRGLRYNTGGWPYSWACAVCQPVGCAASHAVCSAAEACSRQHTGPRHRCGHMRLAYPSSWRQLPGSALARKR